MLYSFLRYGLALVVVGAVISLCACRKSKNTISYTRDMAGMKQWDGIYYGSVYQNGGGYATDSEIYARQASEVISVSDSVVSIMGMNYKLHDITDQYRSFFYIDPDPYAIGKDYSALYFYKNDSICVKEEDIHASLISDRIFHTVK